METEKAKYENDLRLWQSYTNIFKNDTVGFFDTKYFFPQAADGFDVVIGNPPYVRADNPAIAEQRELIIKSKEYETLSEKWDLMVPFYEKGLKQGLFHYYFENGKTHRFGHYLADSAVGKWYYYYESGQKKT